MATRLFNTHHSPTGAWASLTFGHGDLGISIDLEDPKVKNSGSLLVGLVQDGAPTSICFSEDTSLKEFYGAIKSEEITRTLSFARDTYAYRNISFTTYTPFTPLPDPKAQSIHAQDCLPGILMEVTIDNSDGVTPVTAFWGLALNDAKRVYASEDSEFLRLRHKDEWEFATPVCTDTHLLRGLDARAQLVSGEHIVQQNGVAFVTMTVPAGETRTLPISWTVYKTSGCNGTIAADYYYSHIFPNLSAVTAALHENKDNLCELSQTLDIRYASKASEADTAVLRAELFYQAVRAYYASSQLLVDSASEVHWNISEGGYLWRNTMDLCADHITWELRHNPWVVRSLMEDFLAHYTYTDQVTFDGDPSIYPGGISFTHDMGCYFTYSKDGHSAYERENKTKDGFYFYMTTEELLNGIYCICSYVLATGDTEWLSRYPSLLDNLMTSLENRDAAKADDRNGILTARTTRGGSCNLESTTYDALDHSLLDASGNLYVFLKTWCALALLSRCADLTGSSELSRRAKTMRDLCVESASLFESESHPWLKANAYKDIPGAVCAAAESLAVPYSLGVLSQSDEPRLFELTKKHLTACLQTGVCIDSVSGGLRLSSTSTNTWPSKSVLTVYVAEKALGMTIPTSVIEEIVGWAQVSAAKATICDQINSETRQVVGAMYYPRIVTAILWLE